MPSADNKRVAKNAVALTIRMLLVTVVGLFTSRIVLQALGVDDYGIYGVVGGVVGMASFLNAAMAGATSRFITFELGRNDQIKLRTIFSSALLIHIGIAIVVAVLAETIGLWFLNTHMNFPPGRMYAVNVLYQFTILSMFVSFTQVPYTAAIIAHERMSIYAYFEILNVILKLLIVYILLIVDTDRLIFYAALLLATNTVMAVFYRLYCLRHFPECHFATARDCKTITEMLKFASLDLYGNMCAIVKRQGEPILLNIFFGVVANAGASIALTVCGIICGLTGTITQAFRPQIIKQYALGNIEYMSSVMRRSVAFSIYTFSLISLPFVLETQRILFLWLGQIPAYSVEFIRLIILISSFDVVITINNIAIHATGNIKRLSFINGTLYFLIPVIAFVLLKYVIVNAYVIYAVDAVLMFIVMVIGVFIIRKQINEFSTAKYTVTIMRGFIASAISLIVVYFIRECTASNFYYSIEGSFLPSLLYCAYVSLLCALILSFISFIISFNADERRYVIDTIKGFCKRLNKSVTRRSEY